MFWTIVTTLAQLLACFLTEYARDWETQEPVPGKMENMTFDSWKPGHLLILCF